MTTRHFLGLLLAGASALVGCARRKQELNIGVSCLVPPWSYVDKQSGMFTGFDIELARAACARLGWHPVFYAIKWSDKERMLATGRIDCVWSSFTVTGREKSFTLLGPYATNRVMVVARADSGIRHNADLVGRNMIVESGTTAESALRAGGVASKIGATLGRLQVAPDMESCWHRLREGLGDALAADEDVIRAYIRESSDAMVMVEDRPLHVEGFGVGFQLGNERLRDQIERVLREMERDGECAKLAKEFLGDPGRFHLKEAMK